jgi:hypothetical protein
MLNRAKTSCGMTVVRGAGNCRKLEQEVREIAGKNFEIWGAG